MSLPFRPSSRLWLFAAAISLLLLAFPSCSCEDEEEEEESTEAGEAPPQRDRASEVPTPNLAGPAPDDFEPDDKPRIVELEHWNVDLRATGEPGAMPSHVVARVDRSVVRRGHPSIGDATTLTVTGEDGTEIEVSKPRLTDNSSVFRVDIEGDLVPGQTYEVKFESIEFDYGTDDEGQEDVDLLEFEEPPTTAFGAPALELLDISAARPVDGVGYVEMLFSAPVTRDELQDHLNWSLNGASPSELYYDVEDEGTVVNVQLQGSSSSFADISEIEVTGGQGMTSALGGESMGSLSETVSVGSDSETLEIRAVGIFERAGKPAVRVICHDPSYGDTQYSYYDREIRRSSRDISRRCDVDAEQALENVELDVDADLAFVDTQHGFDILLDLEDPGGPIGFALRAGDYGDDVPELFEGHQQVLEPSRPTPELAIEANGRYLERSDWSQIPIRHRDVELAHVVVRHATSHHFLYWLAGSEDMSGAASYAIAEQYIELDPAPVDVQYSYLDLEDLVGDAKPGAYQVEISAPYKGGLSDSHRFIVSDMQLIAKRASHSDEKVDEIWAWTIDSATAEPIAEMDLELVRQNGRVLADCSTNEQGFCKLSGNWGDIEDEAPFAVVAEGGDQLAYVDWNDTRTEIVEGSVGGKSYDDEPIYRASIRGERTMYRPGETMHFAGFVRDSEFVAEKELPVTVELTDSRGQRAFGEVIETDEVGALEFFYDIPEMASTGDWSVEFLAGDETIVTQKVSVEEFVPERIEIDVELDDNYVFDGDAVIGELQADYFFGVPAADTDFEVECRFSPTQPFGAEWSGYRFGPFGDAVDSVTARTEGTLDEDGRAEFNCTPTDFDERGVYDVTVEASVFEAGSGSPTQEEEQTLLLPSDQMVGIRSPDDRADKTTGARVEGVVVGPDGSIVKGVDTIDLELGSISYTSTRMYRNGSYRWERERHESIDERRTVDVEDGEFAFQAEPRGNSVGIYIRADHDGQITEFEVNPPRYYWWWGRRDLDPRPDDPTHLPIEGPEELVVGESAEFSFEAPASGKALVAVETSRVDSWEWLDVEAGENTWDVEIEAFDANVYVSALYVPTGDDAPSSMDRAFGVQRVSVSRDQWQADVQLDVPEEREPYETLEIGVTSDTAGPNAKVAVAAVDRGILSMQTLEFDDVLDQLFVTHALGVDTFDTVGWYADVSPELFGGGAMGPPPMAPPAIMPVKPTAMWSGLVDMEDGQATVEFEIPDFRGELEIVAIVVDEAHLGQATDRTTIVDPLALQATAPRFASHGDRIEVPVSVTNTTDRNINVIIEAEVIPSMMLFEEEAALEIPGSTTRSLSLAPQERGDVVYEVNVTGRAGAPRLSFRARGDGEESRHFATVPVYPSGPTSVEQDHHSVEGNSFDVLPHLDGWMETSETTELWVTSIPRAPAFRHLDYIFHYPRLYLGYNLYNTVARTRPVVYLDELLHAASPGENSRSASWRIRWGIRSLDRLQNRDGQFRYWINGSHTTGVWGQAYVLDMLTSAEEAGHDVPEWTLRNGLDWLDRRVQRQQDLEDLDLAVWVLSRQGRPNRRAARALLDELPDRPTGRDHERALLATGALYLAGDETVEDDLRELIANPRTDPSVERYSGDFYTTPRHEGLVLEVAIEVFGTDSDLLEDLVERVADRLVDAEVGELNIHELGWSVAPLGRWAKARAENLPESRLIAAGQEIEPALVGDDGSRSWRLHRASEYPEVRIEFDETPDEPVSVFRRTDGVHETVKPEFGSSHLSLSRRYRDVDGTPLDLKYVEVGDLVYVELTASHDENRTIEDLALTDRIPGGFEIEDPRPEGHLRPDWYDSSNEWNVDHFDVRDERLELFGSIGRNYRTQRGVTVKFVYSIRATTAGSFATPPSELVSMYQHDRWARIHGDTVHIHRR